VAGGEPIREREIGLGRKLMFTAHTAALGLDDSLMERGIVDSSGMMDFLH
jgi:hypothetical protein